MADQIVRVITSDGAVMASAITGKEDVYKRQEPSLQLKFCCDIMEKKVKEGRSHKVQTLKLKGI